VALCAFVIYTNPTEPELASLQAYNGRVLLPELRTHFALWVHSTRLFVQPLPSWFLGGQRGAVAAGAAGAFCTVGADEGAAARRH